MTSAAVHEPQTPKPGRFLELDGLRGIAAVSVVVYHYGLSYNSFYPDDPHPWWISRGAATACSCSSSSPGS